MYRKLSDEERAKYIARLDKICKNCEQIKPKNLFPKGSGTIDGLSSSCKACSLIRQKEFHNKNPDAKRRDALRRYYNLTLEQYNDLVKAQGGGCAICGKKQGINKRSLAVDHQHYGEGIVRGILCHNCNKYLVGRNRTGDILIKAGEYINNADTGYRVPEKYLKGPRQGRRQKPRYT